MKPFLLINKPQGMTPFQVITKLKQTTPELKSETIGYAGRLDPMAEGLLLLLIGDENKKRKSYEDLEKTYETDILFGMSTDTYDLLGLSSSLRKRGPSPQDTVTKQLLASLIPSFLGQQTQPYPPYSSQPVNGKPLFYWARENKLAGLTIPTKQITINSIELLSFDQISAIKLHEQINTRIARVSGNFRQEEILALWDEFFKSNQTPTFPVATLRVTCSSGTYIRSLVNRLGDTLGTGAVAMSIVRTKLGEFTIVQAKKM